MIYKIFDKPNEIKRDESHSTSQNVLINYFYLKVSRKHFIHCWNMRCFVDKLDNLAGNICHSLHFPSWPLPARKWVDLNVKERKRMIS